MRSRVAENSIRWPSGAHLVEQRGDLRHEAHVGHLVGLVQDGDVDLVQPAVAAVDEVLEPAGRRDDDLGAAAQRAGLPADRHAADDGGQPQLHGAGVRGERVGHLLGQLAGGDEDQGQRLAGLGALSGGTGQQRRGRRRGSCRSRCGRGRARHGPRGSSAGSRPGSGTARSRPRAPSAASSCAGMSRSANASTAGSAGVIVRAGRTRPATRRAGGRSRRSGRARRNGAVPASRSRLPRAVRAPAAAVGRVREERSFVRVRFMRNLPRCGTYQGIPAAVNGAENRKNGPK